MPARCSAYRCGAGVTAEDIAALVVFLVGDGGRNISGQAIPVDGDATSLG